jgi:hypothetical protein
MGELYTLGFLMTVGALIDISTKHPELNTPGGAVIYCLAALFWPITLGYALSSHLLTNESSK